MQASKPVLFLLHALGSSGRSWASVVAALDDSMECVALDLPGFGANAGLAALTVEEMADWTAAAIRARAPETWLVAGHSMGGKIATILAGWGEAGSHGLTPPAALVLVAASPPAPEPMEETRRQDMLAWVDEGPMVEAHARHFIKENTANPLPDDVAAKVVEDLQRAGKAAWQGWLQRGSLEDWSDAVGTLSTPALIVAGKEDGDLGADAQKRLYLPHLPDARLEVVVDAAHLIPLEQPQALAALIRAHWQAVVQRQPRLPTAFARLIASDRVSARTRAALLERLPEPGADAPSVLSAAQRQVLTALLARVLPQRGTNLDLAARLDKALAEGKGDGWRFATLPDDATAWQQGLDTLAQLAPNFIDLPAAEQDGWVRRMIAGEAGLDGTPGRLSPAQMKQWFEDVRGEAVRTWLAHPAAMARIGYDGFAGGGDGQRKSGYLRTAANEHEGWQRDWQALSKETSL